MSKNLIPAQRRERIQEYLAIHRIVPSAELSLLLEVSEATIRRDLEWMENQGVIERTHGGAIFNERVNLEQEYQQRAQRFPNAKRRIGALAASLIEDGDPAKRIIECAEKENADTIVMGARGLSDIEGLLLGSVSHKIAHLASCTVITVR